MLWAFGFPADNRKPWVAPGHVLLTAITLLATMTQVCTKLHTRIHLPASLPRISCPYSHSLACILASHIDMAFQPTRHTNECTENALDHSM